MFCFLLSNVFISRICVCIWNDPVYNYLNYYAFALLYGNRFGQISGTVDVTAAQYCNVIGEQLQGNDG